jgi:hypothetical protein
MMFTPHSLWRKISRQEIGLTDLALGENSERPAAKAGEHVYVLLSSRAVVPVFIRHGRPSWYYISYTANY